MTGHSKTGGSKAEQWMQCPGSVINQEIFNGMVKPEESPYAAEGTEAHKVAELLVDGWTPPLTVDPDMVKHGREYVNGLKMYQTFYPGVLVTEAKLSRPDISEDIRGTVDAMLLSTKSKTIVVFDYKYGEGERVEAVDNFQLLYYAMLYRNNWAERYILNIHQPRGDNPGWRTWEVRRERIENFQHEVIDALGRIERGDVTLNPGKWCRWCTAKTICKPYIESSVLKVPDGLDNMGFDEIADLYQRKTQVTGWFEKAEAYLKVASMMPNDRYAVGSRKGQTKWSNPVMVEATYPRNQYPQAYNYTLKTPKQFMEVLPKEKEAIQGQYSQSSYPTLIKVEKGQTNDNQES